MLVRARIREDSMRGRGVHGDGGCSDEGLAESLNNTLATRTTPPPRPDDGGTNSKVNPLHTHTRAAHTGTLGISG